MYGIYRNGVYVDDLTTKLMKNNKGKTLKIEEKKSWKRVETVLHGKETILFLEGFVHPEKIRKEKRKENPFLTAS